MKMDQAHKNALESCKFCLERDIPLAVWIAYGIPVEDRLEIIKMAQKALGLRA